MLQCSPLPERREMRASKKIWVGIEPRSFSIVDKFATNVPLQIQFSQKNLGG